MTMDTESGIGMIRTDNCIVDITNNEVWYLLALNLIEPCDCPDDDTSGIYHVVGAEPDEDGTSPRWRAIMAAIA